MKANDEKFDITICTVMHRITKLRSKTNCIYDGGPIRL